MYWRTANRTVFLLFTVFYSNFGLRRISFLPRNVISTTHYSGIVFHGNPDGSIRKCLDLRMTAGQEKENSFSKQLRNVSKAFITMAVLPFLLLGSPVKGDDELARFAAEGNTVGVDGQCFIRKCALETSQCANDPTCLKGLSCLARCKGGSMCSTGCFAKYGSDRLDSLLYCSVEKNDCVHVPGKENTGWIEDKLTDLPGKPVPGFDIKSLDGTWFKIMGLDSRYDCFDCQRNSFQYKDKSTLGMEALFRIPRPSYPGYLQSKIEEELHATDSNTLAHLRSQGQMFGLTFWENWYILGDTTAKSVPSQLYGIPSAFAAGPSAPDLKLVYYTGHTLQGSYKGAFVYSRTPVLDENLISTAATVIRKAGLNPNDFCTIRNSCFLKNKECTTSPMQLNSFTPTTDIKVVSTAKSSSLVDSSSIQLSSKSYSTRSCKEQDFSEVEADPSRDAPFWYLGQRFFQVSKTIATELADWFEDPAILSDWLVSQQEHGILNKPLAVSPFASLPDDY